MCEGCILHGAEIDRSIIGIRSRIGAGVKIKNSLLIGADYYETLDEMRATEARAISSGVMSSARFADGSQSS